jgi:hypothetical protein
MDGQGPQHPLSDSHLDRELESAFGIEPSPEFVARVRTRVASEPERSWWRLGIVEPLFAVAIAGVVLAVVVPQWMRENRPVPPVTLDVVSRRTPGATERSSSAGARELRERLAVPPSAARAFRESRTLAIAVEPSQAPFAAETPLQLSAVIFSEDERQALLALVHAVEEGRVPPLPVATEDFVAMRALRIEPLVIEPLPQLARLEEQGATQ